MRGLRQHNWLRPWRRLTSPVWRDLWHQLSRSGRVGEVVPRLSLPDPDGGLVEAFLVSTMVVGLAEIGDKTQILSLMFAARFLRSVPIIFGILFATLLNHAAAGLAGTIFGTLLAGSSLRWVLGLSFIGFAVWALSPDKYQGEARTISRSGAFVATLVAFFIAEIGDKTQIATVGLAARFEQFYPVVLGTTLGMMLAKHPGSAGWKPDCRQAASEEHPHRGSRGVRRPRHPHHRRVSERCLASMRVVAWASFDFDGDVTNPVNVGEARLVRIGRLGTIRNQRDDGGAMAGSDTPNVEIGNSITPPGLEAVRDFAGYPVPGPHIEQHGSRGTDQVPRPFRNDQHTDNTHHRVEPKPIQQAPESQTGQDEHGNGCVGHDVNIGRAEIVVGVMVVGVVRGAVVLMRRLATIAVAVVQEQGTKQVHE